MDEESQIQVPPSFIALFVEPGRIKPRASRAYITERYEYCEDLAQLLAQRATEIRADLGITAADVLERMGRGLSEAAAGVDPAEARWVATRLAEILGWAPD
ncbi:MAG: ATPase with chaperone activity [Betaproteobacteria bacterium]|nr:ATPase with chaperone activity [Betaproteobacteria bacterium]MBU6514222.1 ATPase with chaperone activity [Betaproteobacteria bacterium]MDE1956438.1 ATPase with chaperone activity [Betaproteobacteria bacterium]MDE2153089.1 ATPase with chaperone activity [Betaproteobacteria bacterium]